MIKGKTMVEEECIECDTEEKCIVADDDILKIFTDGEYAYVLEDVLKKLTEMGYVNPGIAILHAIQNEMLYIDHIENDGTVYIATVEEEDIEERDNVDGSDIWQ